MLQLKIYCIASYITMHKIMFNYSLAHHFNTSAKLLVLDVYILECSDQVKNLHLMNLKRKYLSIQVVAQQHGRLQECLEVSQ